jgi:class 3 adenylate cyclase
MRRHGLFIVVLVCGALLAATRVLEIVDLKALDLQFRVLRAWFPSSVARDVTIVGIDEETLKQFPEPVALWHRHLARFLAVMAQARPAIVGVDVVLPDRSFESVLPGSDRELMKGLLEARRSFPLVLALTLDPAGNRRAIHPPFATLAGADRIGLAVFPVDADGVVRRFDERLGEGGEAAPTLVGQIARNLGVEARPGLIDYRQGAPYEYIPMQQVLQWSDEKDGSALARAFRGRPVLLGVVLPFVDRLRAPVALAAWEEGARDMPGVLLQAQALRGLLDGGLIREAPVAATVALSVAAAPLWFVSSSTALVVAAIIALSAIVFGASAWLLAHGWFVPMVAPALTAAVALGGRNAHDTWLMLRERRRLRASFSGYVSPAVMDEILAGRLRPELGGARMFVCVMFSDIRGYTTRSEGMTPEQVIRFLNRYFERIVALIHERGGSVVSFMGDGIMAVFGSPKPIADPCREAFEAARGMLAFVAELNGQFRAEGTPPIDIGIGLNAGEAVTGHVGSSTRHDYTAIGDVTNVASRVEGLTKEAGYRVVVTRTVADLLGQETGLVPLGPMAIKGHTPVEVYGYDKVRGG